MITSPRCGKPLRLDGRHERSGEAGDPGNPPVCGRPASHPGPCRSEAAVARYSRADAARITEARRAGRYGRHWLARVTPGRAA